MTQQQTNYDSIVVLLPNNEQDVVYWRALNVNSAFGTMQSANLSALLREQQARQWFAIVPGQHILSVPTQLPKKNRRQALQAVPFMLEDNIIDELEHQHFSTSSADSQGLARTAIIDKTKLQQWLKPFIDHGAYLKALVADYELLNHARDSANTDTEQPWLFFNDANLAPRLLIKRPDGSGLSLHLNLLESFLNSQDIQHAELRLCAAHQDINLPENWTRRASNPLLENLQNIEPFSRSLNLLQGKFTQSRPNTFPWQKWKVAAVLLVCALSLQLLQVGLEGLQVSKQQLALKDSALHIAQQALPGKKIRDPHAQIEIAWRALGKGKNQGGFLLLLNKISPTLEESSAVINAINFRQGKVTLNLRDKNLQKLDQLRVDIEKQGLKAVLKNASTDDKGSRCDIILEQV